MLLFFIVVARTLLPPPFHNWHQTDFFLSHFVYGMPLCMFFVNGINSAAKPISLRVFVFFFFAFNIDNGVLCVHRMRDRPIKLTHNCRTFIMRVSIRFHKYHDSFSFSFWTIYIRIVHLMTVDPHTDTRCQRTKN